VHHFIIVAVVAVAYMALAVVARLIAYSPADAWTVWLSSGFVVGALLVQPRARWAAIFAGGFIGAAAFAVSLGSDVVEAAGYGCVEVLACGIAVLIVSRVVELPMDLERPRDLAAVILGGALPLALTGAALATTWHVAAGGSEAVHTFRVWAISNFIGTLLVAPLVIAWSRFRLHRSGGMTMPTFVGGAIACVLFLALTWFIFDAPPDTRFGGSLGASLTYLPIIFMALVALLWGTRGATLAALAGALIAVTNTAQGEGPFAGLEGFLGEAELEVEGYALAIAMTGLLIAVLAAAQRKAMRAARDWQTRFEATIGAHRLLAYEWDPESGRMIVTGDSAQLVGAAPSRLATLADWLAKVRPEDRDAVARRFDERAQGMGAADVLEYRVAAGDSGSLDASDEARAIRDHDGALHRVVGIVRVSAPLGAVQPEAGAGDRA
jgi:integral membrane sensor domain MASE1